MGPSTSEIEKIEIKLLTQSFGKLSTEWSLVIYCFYPLRWNLLQNGRNVPSDPVARPSKFSRPAYGYSSSLLHYYVETGP